MKRLFISLFLFTSLVALFLFSLPDVDSGWTYGILNETKNTIYDLTFGNFSHSGGIFESIVAVPQKMISDGEFYALPGEEVVNVDPSWYLYIRYRSAEGKTYKKSFICPMIWYKAKKYANRAKDIIFVIKDNGDVSIKFKPLT